MNVDASRQRRIRWKRDFNLYFKNMNKRCEEYNKNQPTIIFYATSEQIEKWKQEKNIVKSKYFNPLNT